MNATKATFLLLRAYLSFSPMSGLLDRFPAFAWPGLVFHSRFLVTIDALLCAVDLPLLLHC